MTQNSFLTVVGLSPVQFFDFILEIATFILIFTLVIVIYYSMKRNVAFRHGAGPWALVGLCLLLIPVFFDIMQDFQELFAPDSVTWISLDFIDDIDMIFFFTGTLLGIYGFYRQYLHAEALDIQLKYSEQSKKELAELLPQTVFELDTAGRITYANQKGLDTFGYILEELKLGINVSHLFVPEDMARIRSNIDRIMKGEVFDDHEFTAVHKNGKKFPVLIYSSPIFREGKPVGLRGVILDISHMKKIQTALQESEQRYRQLVKKAPTGIYEIEFDFTSGKTQIVFANDLLLDLFEFTAEEVSSLNLYELLTEESKEIWLKRSAKLLTNEEIDETVEYQVVTKSGRKLWVLLRANWNIEEGVSAKSTASVLDITDLKMTEKELRESEKRFKTIFDNVTDGIILVNPEDGEIFLANQSFCNMFGYSQEEVNALVLADLRQDQIYKNYEEDMIEINQQNLTSATEIPLRKKDGTLFHADINVSPVTLEDKKFHIGIFRNVEERKQAEEIRIELQKRRDNFIRMVNHELRTPLTVLFGYNEFLQKKIDSMSAKQIDDVFSIVTKNLYRLERLISDSQAITQLERGLFQINLEPTDFREFITKILTPYQNLIGDQFDFTFENFIEGTPELYELDSDRIQQVFDNVIDNAIKNSSKDGRIIKVQIKNLKKSIEVNITDNGAGIDSKDLEKIFEQFVTIETEYSTQGTGIGLYLSREIMNSHGGSIIAYSKGKGLGTEILLTFPKN